MSGAKRMLQSEVLKRKGTGDGGGGVRGRSNHVIRSRLKEGVRTCGQDHIPRHLRLGRNFPNLAHAK